MRRIGLRLLLVSSLLASPAALAAACDEASTQLDISQCAAAEAGAVDTELNAVYRRLMAKLETADQRRLREAETAWVAFRDKECTFRTEPFASGSIHASLVQNCRAELSRQRIRDLQTQSACGEGDLSCVPHRDGADD